MESIDKSKYKLHDYDGGDRPISTFSCGSRKISDTPKALYRIVYLFRPTELPDNIYKSGTWLHVCSPCYNFVASIEFHKYELCIHFACSKEHNNMSHNNVLCGVPGYDNGDRCTSDYGNNWFADLVKNIESIHDIYPGNNFSV